MVVRRGRDRRVVLRALRKGHRLGQDPRGDGLHGLPALFGLDEHERDALVVVHLGLDLLDAPEVAQRQVGIAAGLGRAVGARRAQVEVAQEALHIGVVHHRAQDLLAVHKVVRGIVLPAVALVAQAHVGHLAQLPEVFLPDLGGGDAVAHDRDPQHLASVRAEITAQAVGLAGRARKQDGRAVVHKVPDLAEGIAQVGLDILGPAHGLDAGLVPGDGVLHGKARAIDRAADRAAARQHIGGQQREHAARGRKQAQDVVLGAHGQGLGHGRVGAAVLARADRFARVTAHAQAGIHHGVGKALPVALHGDTVLRANRHAGRATAALGLICNLNHGKLPLFSRIAGTQTGYRRVIIPQPAGVLPHTMRHSQQHIQI